MPSTKNELKIDWATHEAAEYACKNWHYSKCLPTGKIVKVGAWEGGSFIGVVLFSRGASPYLGKKFQMTQLEACELTRVALKSHSVSVSRIIRIAILFLKKNSPSMRLIISFADGGQGHHGGIYQAGNWIYTGMSESTTENYIRGKWRHVRGSYAETKTLVKPPPQRTAMGKHRYIYVLDEKVRERLETFSRPYPKRGGSIESDATGLQSVEGGAKPTPPLQLKGSK